VQWWVLEQGLKAWLPKIERAVAQLMEAGFLEARTGADGTVLYRVNRSRVSEYQHRSKRRRSTDANARDE
jgi:hypothetical protein